MHGCRKYLTIILDFHVLLLGEEGARPAAHVAGRILLSQFNIERVLSYGSSLLGSEGAQYDMDLSSAG